MSKYIKINEQIPNITLNKNLYLKNILRYKKAKNLGSLDYGVNFLNVNMSNEEKGGDSILYTLKSFQHRNYKDLQLKTFLPYQQLSAVSQVATKLSNITTKFTDTNFKGYLQILEPTKGGYYGYYGGIVGFIPKSQFKKILAQSIDIKNNNLSNKLYFSNLHNLNELLKPRTLFKAGNIGIQPSYVSNNFNNIKVRKVNKNVINFVFISNK